MQSDGDVERVVQVDGRWVKTSVKHRKSWIGVAVFVVREFVCVLHERPQSDFRITYFVIIV